MLSQNQQYTGKREDFQTDHNSCVCELSEYLISLNSLNIPLFKENSNVLEEHCTWEAISVRQHLCRVSPQSELIVLRGYDNRLCVLRIEVVHVRLRGDRSRGRVIQVVLTEITHQVRRGSLQLHKTETTDNRSRMFNIMQEELLTGP